MRVHVSGEEWYPVPEVLHEGAPWSSRRVFKEIPDDVVERYEQALNAFQDAVQTMWEAWDAASPVDNEPDA